MELRDRHILILGLGVTGLAIAHLCVSRGARILIWDSRTNAPQESEFVETFGAENRLAPDIASSDARLALIDLVAISPGLALDHGPAERFVTVARTRGTPVWGEFEFFAQELAALAQGGYRPKVIGVTGTNGKTTVTSLTGHLCRRAGKSVVVAGNIGPPVLDAFKRALNEDALPEVWVLELSSFQLETTHSLAFDAAAFLNLSQDHLDWHGSMAAYRKSKLRIFTKAQTRLVNRADKAVASGEAELARAPGTRVVSFGLDAPRARFELGVVVHADMRWLALAESADQPQPLARRTKVVPLGPVHVTRLMPVEALRIRGDHNVLNALAALGLARAIDLPVAPLLRALAEYRGESHRVEVIGRLQGIDFIDDSKGTNVGATVAALNGLGQRVVLIAGGLGKGQDFSPLASPVARHARAVVLIGEDRMRIKAAISKAANEAQVVIDEKPTLETAVERAFALAEEGDAVLLSPACASLDMFRDYAHRAAVFASAMRALMVEAGQPC
jgi:UDP-N-acetylmuramoylalanine--D-glutamate ligase